MMRRLLLALLLLLVAPGLGFGQDGGDGAPQTPVLRMTFDETEAIPGQPLTLRLTILVPTYMPAPPAWPSFEAPNLLVRLPEGATGPTSARVGAKTWAGVSRRYQIVPMVPGRFSIPAKEVTVTWADPATNEATRIVLRTEPLTITGVVPAGAESLDPFIAAADLTLTQQVEGDPASMTPGASVSRTVTATVRGVSPMFLPDLLPPVSADGLAAYPDAPVVTEDAGDGGRSGSVGGARTERVVLVAKGGGSGTAPAVTLDWYNLQTGRVETASVEGFEISITGPPADDGGAVDWRMIAAAAVAGLFVVALVLLAARRLGRGLRRWIAARREAWEASEAHAYRRLRRAIGRRDLSSLFPALDTWADRLPGADPRCDPLITAALTGIGGTRFGKGGDEDSSAPWAALGAAVKAARRRSRRTAREPTLPPLNPAPPPHPT